MSKKNVKKSVGKPVKTTSAKQTQKATSVPKKKSVFTFSFFLLLIVMIVNIVETFIYREGFFKTEYEAQINVILPLLCIPCLIIALIRPLARYAPIGMFAVELCALLQFVSTTYMHLTTAFFGGISGNVLEQAGFAFSFCTLALLGGMLVSSICIFTMSGSGRKNK